MTFLPSKVAPPLRDVVDRAVGLVELEGAHSLEVDLGVPARRRVDAAADLRVDQHDKSGSPPAARSGR
jgi:hypothetical protein